LPDLDEETGSSVTWRTVTHILTGRTLCAYCTWLTVATAIVLHRRSRSRRSPQSSSTRSDTDRLNLFSLTYFFEFNDYLIPVVDGLRLSILNIGTCPCGVAMPSSDNRRHTVDQ